MLHSGLHYFPVSLPFLLVLSGLLALLVGMAAVRLLRHASESMGIGLRTLIGILGLSLLGSYINIPIAYLPAKSVIKAAEIDFFGITYVVPVVREWNATVIAVNVGGALVPVALSLYLIVKQRMLALSVVGVAIVAVACHWLARPVPGLGIAIPVVAPVVITGIVAMALARRQAAPLAYISGSLGTLIGADIWNLGKLQGLGAPIASIGGAGTFDGIFLTGLLAVLYAGVVRFARD